MKSIHLERAREVLTIEIDGLCRIRDGLDARFDDAVNLILERLSGGGKVVVTGVGKNLHIGQKISSTLTSTGTPSVLLHPAEAMHGDLGILDDRDAVLALSYSGESEELTALVPLIRRRDVPIISLTGQPDSILGQNSQVVIALSIEREACPFNLAPTASTTATLAVGDALAMALLQARGFKREDYAKLHPGGAIGRTLLLRVDDIMRRDEHVARVRLGSRVRDALLAMTSARAGSAAVVDEQDRIAGIFTDGDLRRHFGDTGSIGERLIDEVMTPNPITLTRNHLAVDVLTLFEKHKIDDLLVEDDQKRLVGIVDIQDLPKFKIL